MRAFTCFGYAAAPYPDRGRTRVSATTIPTDVNNQYSAVAKLLHWLIFALVAAQFVIAFTMPDIHRDTPDEGLVAWHLSVGAVILLVVVLRLLWRLSHPAPAPLAGTPQWQRSLYRLVHGLLYFILVVDPVLGWGNASSRGYPVSLFGVIPLPALFEKGSRLGHSLGDIHSTLAWVLLFLIGVHIAVALYHQFIVKDGTLRRMLP
jgi:cytochrome b561